MTITTSSRPRSGCRESVSSALVSGGRIRKNFIANSSIAGTARIGGANHRPRASTIRHVDLSGLGWLDEKSPSFSGLNALDLVGNATNLGGLSSSTDFGYRGISNTLGHNGLLKLDTPSINDMDLANSVRKVPPYASLGGFDIDQLFSPGTTVNPGQLHCGGFASAMQPNFSPLEPFTVHPATDLQPQVDDFGWMRNWTKQMSHDNNDHAIENSSLSRMSSGESSGDYSESMNISTVGIPIPNDFRWPQQDTQSQNAIGPGIFQLGALGTGLPNLDAPQGTTSPNTLHGPTPTADAYLSQAMMQRQNQHQLHHSQADVLQSPSQNFFATPLSAFNSDSPSMSSSLMIGSARQSYVVSMSSNSITDATVQTLRMTLSQPSVLGHNHRKCPQPSINFPLCPGGARSFMHEPNLPSTADIRRYVDAFIQFAHPHLPVLHIPTLSFELIDYATSIKEPCPHIGLTQNGMVGGGGRLILGVAAVGALYEYDRPASKELFDAAKKMITLYLEECRKADLSAAGGDSNASNDSSHHTPLRLVQAMLLNVVYGHQCGDKTAADIASYHCAALVSLARAAGLDQPLQRASQARGDREEEQTGSNYVGMNESSIAPGGNVSGYRSAETELEAQWYKWKVAEERKRTFFAIFILSSLLSTAYNHTPTIMNSEILLDLPCDEELYAAESAQEWQTRGGLAAAEQNAVPFALAFSSLLKANQRQGSNFGSTGYQNKNPLGALQAEDGFADNELRPSAFGCLVLINALHNYIWETRSRHQGRQWTTQETELMISHIKPALNAWLAAWKADDRHKLARSNTFGIGPLAADSIPLLDLAFVRLFVNLGRSKEAFWQRDFDTMANEIAHGAEIVQHAEASLNVGSDRENPSGAKSSSTNSPGNNTAQRRQCQASISEQASSRRERHLRKAAFYAADSLTIACSYNLTYADLTAHELPAHCAMCFFDCTQVLAEWACTVQERVGKYLGVLGRDHFDYTQVPAIMVLETEDVELLRKIERICESLEAKRFQQENLLAIELQNLNSSATVNSMHNNVNFGAYGYGSKILRITAMMLEKAVAWPGGHS